MKYTLSFAVGPLLGSLLILGCSGDDKPDDNLSDEPSQESQVSEQTNVESKEDLQKEEPVVQSTEKKEEPEPPVVIPVANNRVEALAARVPADAFGLFAAQDLGGLLKDYHIIGSDDKFFFMNFPQIKDFRQKLGIDIFSSLFLSQSGLQANEVWGLSGVLYEQTPCVLAYIPTTDGKKSASFIRSVAKGMVSFTEEKVSGSLMWNLKNDAGSILFTPEWVVLGTCDDGSIAGASKTKKLVSSIAQPSFKSALSAKWFTSTADERSKPWKGLMVVNPTLPPAFFDEMSKQAYADPMAEFIVQKAEEALKSLEGIAVTANMTGGEVELSGMIACNEQFKEYSFLQGLNINNDFMKKIPGEAILVGQLGTSPQEMWDSILDSDFKLQVSAQGAYLLAKEKFGFHPYYDFLAKLNHTMGMSLVYDGADSEIGIGGVVWVSLLPGHKMNGVLRKMITSVEDNAGQKFSKTIENGVTWYELSKDGVTVTLGIVDDNMVLVFGEKYPAEFKSKYGQDSIVAKLDAKSQTQLASKSHFSGVMNFRGIEKLLGSHSSTYGMSISERQQVEEALKAFGNMLSSVKYDIPNRRITFGGSLSASTKTGFADLFKVELDKVMANR